MENYRLATSFGRANIQDRLWYVQAKANLPEMLSDTNCKLVPGDKAWAIKERELFILDFDEVWQPM